MNKKIGYLFVYVLEKDKKGAGIFPAPFSVYTFLNPHAARVTVRYSMQVATSPHRKFMIKKCAFSVYFLCNLW